MNIFLMAQKKIRDEVSFQALNYEILILETWNQGMIFSLNCFK